MKNELMQLNNYKAKKAITKIVADLFRYIFLIAYSYVLIYPIVFLIIRSIELGIDVYDPTVQWIPKHITSVHYRFAFRVLDYGKSFLSTVFNMLLAGLIEVFTCLIAAYGLARYNFKGKKLIVGLVILMILVPSNMTIIPNYMNMQNLDLFGILGLFNKITGIDLRISILDTPFAFWLPSLLGVGLRGGLFIYIYMQFFKGLPKELEEAAWIDGAGLYRTLFRIIFPTASVSIVTVSLLSMVWHWNEYYLPQLYLADDFPLSVVLANFMNRAMVFGGEPGFEVRLIQAASCVLIIIPILIFYLIMQRKFISSIALTGIVG